MDEKTYFIPSDLFEGKDLKPGDVITVTGKDSEGNLEVVCEHKKEERWQDDLERSMPESFGGSMKEEPTYG